MFELLRGRRSHSKYRMSIQVTIGVRKNFAVGSGSGNGELAPPPSSASERTEL